MSRKLWNNFLNEFLANNGPATPSITIAVEVIFSLSAVFAELDMPGAVDPFKKVDGFLARKGLSVLDIMVHGLRRQNRLP